MELIIEHGGTFAFHETMLVLLYPLRIDYSHSIVSSGNTLVDIDKMHVSYTMLAGGHVFSSSSFHYFLGAVVHEIVLTVSVVVAT